jgi:hypothetical protein
VRGKIILSSRQPLTVLPPSAINADIGLYTNFTLNAKLITNPSSVCIRLYQINKLTKAPAQISSQGPFLTGVGAVATNTPIPVTNISNVTSTSTIATSSSTSLANFSVTSSAAPIQTQDNTSTSAGLSGGEKGAIAGGSVGGAILVALLALLFMSYRRGRRYRKEAEASKMLRSQSSRDMSQLTRLDLLNDDAHSYDPPHTATRLVDMHRSQGSISVAGSLERDSTSGPSVNVRDLAAEIARNIRQELNPQDHTGLQQDATSLATVPEQVVLKAVSRAESASGAGSTRGTESSPGPDSTRGTEYTRRTDSVRGRQLPRPPLRADVRSVDTLPEYVPGLSR